MLKLRIIPMLFVFYSFHAFSSNTTNLFLRGIVHASVAVKRDKTGHPIVNFTSKNVSPKIILSSKKNTRKVIVIYP